MRIILILLCLTIYRFTFSQSLPINFEENVSTSDFVDFDGGVATVIENPQKSGINTSEKVAQIIRDGGAIWSGSKIQLDNFLDFSSMNKISMKVYTSAPIGTKVKFKLEGQANTERDVYTTVTNEWEVLTWDFTGEPMNFTDLVFMFDFGNVGDGSISSTFLFDDIQQLTGGFQIDWPCNFEEEGVDYTVTDFDGNQSSLVIDPTDENNRVIKSIKPIEGTPTAGTTIGTPAGFATDIPLNTSDSKMTVRVWSPLANIPIRLKVEDSNDPTHTCETETKTTVAGEWETLEFDFNNEAPGTATLSFGLSMGWTYNMASIFFNFATEGSISGEQTYYFDDINFGGIISSTNELLNPKYLVYPNPTINDWNVTFNTNSNYKVALFDFKGQLLYQTFADQYLLKLPSNNLSPGVYFCRFSNESEVFTIKLVKD